MDLMAQALPFIDYKVTVIFLDKTNELSMAEGSTVFLNEILPKF